MRRITLTLPDDLVSEIDILATHLYCSRSAFISLSLEHHLGSLSDLADMVSRVPRDYVSLSRARGESIDDISQRYREFLNEFKE